MHLHSLLGLKFLLLVLRTSVSWYREGAFPMGELCSTFRGTEEIRVSLHRLFLKYL